MAFTKQTGRQDVVAAIANVTFGAGKDLTTTPTYYEIIQLPPRAVLVGGYITIKYDTAPGNTGLLISVSDDVGYGYLTDFNMNTNGFSQLSLVGYSYSGVNNIGVYVHGRSSFVTAGSFQLTVLYIVEGRETFSQG